MEIKIDRVTNEFKISPDGLNQEINTMLDLLRRVFHSFAYNHFTDFKMIKDYIEPVKFSKILGDDIVDYLREKLLGFEDEYIKMPNAAANRRGGEQTQEENKP